MSIATLKKKTQAQYNNLSVGSKTGFSINGTLRNQGYVGQTMLSRHLPTTLMRGNVARGHGGCCGNYYTANGHIIQSGIYYLNDPKVVKSSVLDTNGLIMTKYRWIRRPQPYSSVKPVSEQQSYIDGLSKNTIACIDIEKNKSDYNVKECPITNNTCSILKNNNKKPSVRYPRRWSNITKPETFYSTRSQSSFIKALGAPCAAYDEQVIKKSSSIPLPGPGKSW